MSTPRRTSVIVLITLAELAWLASFGLLFAYRNKVGELGNMRRRLDSTAIKLVELERDLEAKAPDLAKMRRDLNESLEVNQVLRMQLEAFVKHLRNVSPEEAARRLTVAGEVKVKLDDAEMKMIEKEKSLTEALDQQRKLRLELVDKGKSETAIRKTLATTTAEVERLRKQSAEILSRITDRDEQIRVAQAKVAELEEKLHRSQSENRQFTDTLRQREAGEYSIRRELTGLPDGDLRRVIFLVDTSSSMRSSPAWDSTRKLIRTWLEFLPVEECAMVTFNDAAVGFPEKSYHRVRQADGTILLAQREELLRAFDRARTGTFTDLLRGLRRAYEYPTANVIVLFTDGHPHVDFQRDSAFAREILTEAAKHKGVPILTVALGSYEIVGAGGPRPQTNAPVWFLKALARQTGGNFLAR